jgi:hypothetical protein
MATRSMDEVDFHNEMVASGTYTINFPNTRMTRFSTFCRHFQPTGPALNFVHGGETGADASKAALPDLHSHSQKNGLDYPPQH